MTYEPYEPTLHKPVPMGTRVKIQPPYPGDLGTVVGISMIHVVFSYIVLLDKEIETEYGPQRAIVIPGPAIETPEGEHFRLET